MKSLGAFAAAVLALATVPAAGQFNRPLPDPRLKAPPVHPKELRYGKLHWKEILYFPAKGPDPAPLIIAFKRTDAWTLYRARQEGFALAIIPFDTYPPDPLEDVENSIAAITCLKDQADELKIDMTRIALLGTAGGAHDAALFGTDPSLIEKAGLPFSSVKAVVAINGVDFDIPRRAGESGYLSSFYKRLYGKDPEVQRRVSPATHIDLPNAPAFMLMVPEEIPEARTESRIFAEGLARVGTGVQTVVLPKLKQDVLPTYFLAQSDSGSGHELLPFLHAALDRSQPQP